LKENKKWNFPPQLKEAMLPPIGYTLNFGPYIFQVSYRHPGKMRFTLNFIGMTVVKKEGDEPHVVTRDGEQMSAEDFTQWQREKFPQMHEKNRNAKNTTLNVHSTVQTPVGGIK
jgi:hypothetical protein